MSSTMHVAARMAREEYLALPEFPPGVRFELLDGELVTMNDPLAVHQIVAGRLYAALLAWSDSRPEGGRVLLPVDTDVGPDTVFGPDVQWFSPERTLPSIRERPWPVGDLVVEVAAPSTARYDALVKAARYADAGAREVWLVDPAGPTVRVLRGAGRTPVVFSTGDVVSSPLLPGFALPVADLDR